MEITPEMIEKEPQKAMFLLMDMHLGSITRLLGELAEAQKATAKATEELQKEVRLDRLQRRARES